MQRSRGSPRSARMRRRTRTRLPLILPPTWSTCPWRMWTGNPCCASCDPLRERRGTTMEDTGSVLFLCPHNAAKSLLAVAYFDRLAGERGLPFRAESAGTEPAEGPAPAVVAALQAEGVDVSDYHPRHVEPRDLAGAHHVISMGCDLTDLWLPAERIERWDDVPPVSQDLKTAYAAIRRHVETLVTNLDHDGLRQ